MARRPQPRPTRLLPGLLLGHMLLGLLYHLATPIFEAPDEDGHYLFVRYLQVHRALPVQTLDANAARAHHPPLYHLLAAALTAWVPVEGGADRIDMQPNPKVWFRYDDPEPDNKSMWVHYGPEERWPYAGQALVIHVVRLISLAFSTLGVLFTYLAARPLRPGIAGERLALLAAALVAFHPMLLFMSGVVQNNTTAIASSAAVLYALSLGLRPAGFRLRLWIVIGLLLAVGILLQVSALALAAPIGLALLYETWRTRRWHVLVTGGLAVGVPVLALTGWWFLRNLDLYGDLTGNRIIAALWCCDPIRPWPAFRLFLTGLLGRFGQGLMITYPPVAYYFAGALALFALAGWAWAALFRTQLRTAAATASSPAAPSSFDNMSFRAAPPVRGEESALPSVPRPSPISPTLILWGLHLAAFLAVSLALLHYALTVIPGVSGRYLFPAFPSMAIILAGGWLNWFRPRWQSFAATTAGALMLLAALYGLYGLLIPTYRIPPPPSASELRAMTPLDANLGDTARVLGYKVSGDAVRPGDTLVVTLYWQPLSRTDVPYTIFVHLSDPALGPLAQKDTYPGLGNYATTVWDVGRSFVDTYRLPIPPDAPEGPASLVVGLYNEATGTRLTVAGANAGADGFAIVQEIMIGGR